MMKAEGASLMGHSEPSGPAAIITPTGAQLEFIKCGKHFKKFQAGQGGGKTVAGVFEVLRYVWKWDGATVICTEPTYPMVRDILRPEFDRQLSARGEVEHVSFHVSANKYTFPNGSEIWLRQCDQADKLRGPSLAAAWMDEAAQCPLQAYQILSGRLRQQGYPHTFMFTGTPRGQNWFHWAFTQGDRPKGAAEYIGDTPGLEDQVASFRWAALDNPNLDAVTKSLLEAAYAPGTLAHRQEVLGEIVAYEGFVYPQFQFDTHVRDYLFDEEGLPRGLQFVRVIGGVDWGWAVGVALVIGLDTRGNVWVLDETYESQRDVGDFWAPELLRLQRAHNVDMWYCDPSEPAYIAKVHGYQGRVRAEPAENAVIPGITAVASRFAAGTLFVGPKCINTIRELGLYAWKQDRQGEVREDVPEKANDHAMDGLRYGIMGLFAPRQVSVTRRIIDPSRIGA